MTSNFQIKFARFKLNKWLLCIYLLMFFMLIDNSQLSFSQLCDPEIEPIKNLTLKYQKRDENRCEGFYSSLVSVEVIDVVGVTKGDFYFETREDEILELSSPLVNDRRIYIRAVGIPLKVYYRMDAYLDAGQTMTWPMGDVAYLRELSSKDICVFGWTGDETDKIYIPVAAASKLAPVTNDGQIHLYLRTSVDVKNVKWRAAGTCISLQEAAWEDAPKSSCRAGKPIQIILPANGADELCLEVAAQNQKTAQWLKKKNIRVIVGKK
ncbi:MAG: hypothetical protein JSV88_33735 [Candidatus Aminicenantes bacterium]|nr:MAG: hypothetical protein JSV88_33735 [Candidatus Aminicenantes bacterium]